MELLCFERINFFRQIESLQFLEGFFPYFWPEIPNLESTFEFKESPVVTDVTGFHLSYTSSSFPIFSRIVFLVLAKPALIAGIPMVEYTDVQHCIPWFHVLYCCVYDQLCPCALSFLADVVNRNRNDGVLEYSTPFFSVHQFSSHKNFPFTLSFCSDWPQICHLV